MSQVSYPRSLKSFRFFVSSLFLTSIVLIGTLLVTLIFSLLAYQIYFLERVHLGVYVNQVDVSTLTRSELYHLINAQSQEILNRPIQLASEEGSWSFTAASLGMQIDVAETVNLAYSQGRRGSFLADSLEQIALMNQSHNIQPVIIFDTGPANNILTNLANELNRPSVNAQLWLEDDLSIGIVPAQTGRLIDIETSRAAIEQAVLLRQDTPIPLKIHYSLPEVTGVDAAYHKLQSLLDTSLTFTHNDQTWSLDPAKLASLISIQTLKNENTPSQINLSIDQDGLKDYFETIAQEITQPPINAWFHLDTTTWTLIPLQESQPGYELDIPAAVEMVTALLDYPRPHQLTLPAIVHPPLISSEYSLNLGINELVSSATSYFEGSSPERIQNIQMAAIKFHGLVIPPGEIFSFNEHLGPVTAEQGFAEGLIIAGDRTAVGIGGGVCQVSTTAFRAALYGGFEIVERWAHGYRVGWYETNSGPGLDATIYSPQIDIKFRNDTNTYILVQTEIDLEKGILTFNFYGTSPRRVVTVSDPVITNIIAHGPPIYQEDPTLGPDETQQVEWAKDGLDVTVTRTVFEGDQVIHRDRIFSRYRPWRAKYQVGPQSVKLSEESLRPEETQQSEVDQRGNLIEN